MGACVALPLTARSTLFAAVREPPLRFLRLRCCMCCKREFRQALIKAAPPARSRFVASASERNPRVLNASADRPGGASRPCSCTAHRLEFDQKTLSEKSPWRPATWSSPAAQLSRCARRAEKDFRRACATVRNRDRTRQASPDSPSIRRCSSFFRQERRLRRELFRLVAAAITRTRLLCSGLERSRRLLRARSRVRAARQSWKCWAVSDR